MVVERDTGVFGILESFEARQPLAFVEYTKLFTQYSMWNFCLNVEKGEREKLQTIVIAKTESGTL
jgi:hypothetical protein